MLQLENFFAPLNTFNLFVFLLFVTSCEIVGYWIARFFVGKIPTFLRGAVWLLGLGGFVFVYFLSHFFIPFSIPSAICVLIILLLLSTKLYVEENGLNSLFVFMKHIFIPLVIVLIVLPKIFIKSSQPPYIWDEMAYHFISPYTLYFEEVWNTGDSLYQNLPRLLDTGYIALFSLSKTYSVARLLSFTIFITFLTTVYVFLKKRLNAVSALVFFALTLFFKENFLLWSTFGYVDIGTTSFVLIGFILLLDYIFEKNTDSILFGFAFFGMAVGSKYSALTQFLTFFVISTVLIVKRRGYKILYNRKYLMGLILFTLLGGYWYLKNLVVTGNPIYPILFGCKFPVCESIDFSYTTPFTIANISTIFSRIFLDDSFLMKSVIASTILSLTLGNTKVKTITIAILLFVVIEILFVKNITGHDGRYFYHWPILDMLITSLPVSVLEKNRIYLKYLKKWKARMSDEK